MACVMAGIMEGGGEKGVSQKSSLRSSGEEIVNEEYRPRIGRKKMQKKPTNERLQSMQKAVKKDKQTKTKKKQRLK